MQEEEPLPMCLQRESMPRHVAVIVDGNSRWAKQRGLPTALGHEAGQQRFIEILNLSIKWGIKVLSVYMFSFENWARSEMEVQSLISLFEEFLKSQTDAFVRDNVRISVIGDLSKLPDSLQKLILEVEEKTKDNCKLELIMAFSYSGRYDIVEACKSIAQKVKDDLVQIEDINDGVIEQELKTNCTKLPCPDLLIRTSGELRISNFMLWQLAYTELFFTPTFWPDFGKVEFAEALISFQQRKRRYGRRN